MSLYKMIEAVRNRRGLYNVYTSRDMYHLISGYEMAVSVNKINDPTSSHFSDFAEWLRQKKPNLSNFDWLGIIEIYSTPTSSLFNFFNQFDEFLKQVPLHLPSKKLPMCSKFRTLIDFLD
jgi:hypothetical protein